MQSAMSDHLFSSFLWLWIVQTWEEQGGEVGFEGSSGNGHEAFLEGNNDLFGVILALEAAVVAFVVSWVRTVWMTWYFKWQRSDNQFELVIKWQQSDNPFERSIAAPSIWNRQFETSMDRWFPTVESNVPILTTMA
ncbi:hypothetical protein PVK06_032685 [Gossypium arboreum]|uniref:Uncharacterized protein n=1 Tax=Gossypium arboreum TaxID=29729 RepID=A0ABR0NUM0_GOSAR|nr:hypothetical protein PVK06_032685 [Gossypium arboreum]